MTTMTTTHSLTNVYTKIVSKCAVRVFIISKAAQISTKALCSNTSRQGTRDQTITKQRAMGAFSNSFEQRNRRFIRRRHLSGMMQTTCNLLEIHFHCGALIEMRFKSLHCLVARWHCYRRILSLFQ